MPTRLNLDADDTVAAAFFTTGNVASLRAGIGVGQAGGLASLGGDAKIPHAQLPFEAYGQRFAASSQAAMLGLTAQPGDSCLRSDDGNHTWLLVDADPTQLSSWLRQSTPTDAPVQSVNGQTGAVLVTPMSIGAAPANIEWSATISDPGDLTSAVPNPTDGQTVRFADGNATVYVYQFFHQGGQSYPAPDGFRSIAGPSSVGGAWLLQKYFDPIGSDDANFSTIFPGDVYVRATGLGQDKQLSDGTFPFVGLPYSPSAGGPPVAAPQKFVRNYKDEADAGVDNRIFGKTAATGTRALYSATNDGTHVYTRNTSLWCADLDWTAISVASTATDFPYGWTVTAITPRHGITAAHTTSLVSGSGTATKVGTVIYWVDRNNVAYSRTVTAVTAIAGDEALVTWDSDLPAAITPAAIMRTTLPTGFAFVGCPIAYMRQDRAMYVGEVSSLQNSGQDNIVPAAASNRTAWTYNSSGSPVVAGDSSRPVFLILGGRPVLLTCWYLASGSGPDVGVNAAALQTAIGSGYGLTVASMPSYPAMQVAGDIGGTQSSPLVTGLRGVSLTGTPVAGNALVFNGTQWSLGGVPAQDLVAANPGGTAPNYTIAAGQSVMLGLYSANANIVLPFDPPNGTKVAVGLVSYSGSSYTLTITPSSNNYLDPTSIVLSQGQRVVLIYNLNIGRNWSIVSNSLTPNIPDTRYVQPGTPTLTGPLTLHDGTITTADNGQRILSTSGNAGYLYAGTGGLIVNNQANTAQLLTLTNAGALSLPGAATLGSTSTASLNITAATNPAVNYGGSLYTTRTAVGTMSVGTTQGGTDGTGAFATFKTTIVTYSALPPSPSVGMECAISDSTVNTWGTNVTTGGGSYYARINWNGSAWTVVGK